MWSRAYSDEVQTGSTTPLFYTDIQPRMTNQKINAMLWTETPECLGYAPERFRDIPYFRWYCARAYYNLAWERERIRMFIPPFARDEAALWPFPVEEREEIRKLRFNWIRFLWIMLKLHVTDPKISLLMTTGEVYENLETVDRRRAGPVGCARSGDRLDEPRSSRPGRRRARRADSSGT